MNISGYCIDYTVHIQIRTEWYFIGISKWAGGEMYHVVRKDITIETGNRDHSDNYVIYPYIISPT